MRVLAALVIAVFGLGMAHGQDAPPPSNLAYLFAGYSKAINNLPLNIQIDYEPLNDAQHALQASYLSAFGAKMQSSPMVATLAANLSSDAKSAIADAFSSATDLLDLQSRLEAAAQSGAFAGLDQNELAHGMQFFVVGAVIELMPSWQDAATANPAVFQTLEQEWKAANLSLELVKFIGGLSGCPVQLPLDGVDPSQVFPSMCPLTLRGMELLSQLPADQEAALGKILSAYTKNGAAFLLKSIVDAAMSPTNATQALFAQLASATSDVGALAKELFMGLVKVFFSNGPMTPCKIAHGLDALLQYNNITGPLADQVRTAFGQAVLDSFQYSNIAYSLSAAQYTAENDMLIASGLYTNCASRDIAQAIGITLPPEFFKNCN